MKEVIQLLQKKRFHYFLGFQSCIKTLSLSCIKKCYKTQLKCIMVEIIFQITWAISTFNGLTA